MQGMNWKVEETSQIRRIQWKKNGPGLASSDGGGEKELEYEHILVVGAY